MAVTINDVAKRAGVSHTTVSWVIHDDPRITQKTKDKVNKAIEELNYHPNYSARSLVKGKTDVIAVVTNFFSTYFELSVLRGIETAMGECEKEYNLNLYSTWNKEEKVLTEILYGKRADAVILLSETPSQKIIKEYIKRDIPLILVENYHDQLPCIKSDNIQGAREATNFLFDQGRKRVAIIVEAQNKAFIPGLSQVERLKGFEEVYKERGLKLDDSLIIEIEQFRMDTGREIARDIVNKNLNIDGIFCAAGDKTALGLIDEFKKLGKDIPKDYSIVGFDDIDIAELVSPPLTTVRQDLQELGHSAYNIAVKKVDKEEVDEEHIILETTLIKRESA